MQRSTKVGQGITLADVQENEAAFREYQRAWLRKRDASYRKTEEIARHNAPLRHPKDKEWPPFHDREYLWTDALWCQDSHPDAFEEFFEYEFEPGGEGKLWEWCTQVFNEEFIKLYPELAHVLDG